VPSCESTIDSAFSSNALDSEILSLGQLYRDRADCENSFDELKSPDAEITCVGQNLRPGGPSKSALIEHSELRQQSTNRIGAQRDAKLIQATMSRVHSANANFSCNGFFSVTTRLEGFPTLAPWSKLSWGFLLPVVFVGNIVVATSAWIIVGLVMR
jgi:hypothetical protein